MPDIVLKNAGKRFEGDVDAVSGLDLEINDGDFMCLLGPSGCGKTTTLRLIAGLENLSAGEIAVGERVVDSRAAGAYVPPEDRGMGLVFQSYALWPHLTIERNTDFGLRLRGLSRQEREQRVAHVLQTLGIDELRNRYPAQLSGGQQQRVALARMLAVNPEVLLLDEPLSNLDARLRLEMRTELKRLHKQFGTTIVFVTHDQWEAMTLATRIAVMHRGELQQVGTPDDIYDRPANRFVAEFVGNPPINIIEIDAGQAAGLSYMTGAFLANAYLEHAQVGSVGIRPECIRLNDAASGTDGAALLGTARITAILPTGGSWIVELDVGGVPLFMTTNHPPHYAEGTTQPFRINRSDMHLFDRDNRRMAWERADAERVAS